MKKSGFRCLCAQYKTIGTKLPIAGLNQSKTAPSAYLVAVGQGLPSTLSACLARFGRRQSRGQRQHRRNFLNATKPVSPKPRKRQPSLATKLKFALPTSVKTYQMPNSVCRGLSAHSNNTTAPTSTDLRVQTTASPKKRLPNTAHACLLIAVTS